jgi:muconolactone D-isomerase
MEWLVSMIVRPPLGVSDEEIAERSRAEAAAVARLAESGALVRVWRVPGQWANWSLWHLSDATRLHAELSALPLWPWAEIIVHPLAVHPNDPNQPH